MIVEALANRLLAALPVSTLERLLPHLAADHVPLKRVLFEPGSPVDELYFPVDCVISLVTPLEQGAIVEVATVGNEGVVGVPLMERGSLAVRAICQVSGRALHVPAHVIHDMVRVDRRLASVLSGYTQALFSQVAQAAACNRLHTNEERLSRWLLMSHDRVASDEFPITHEFLGQMLGSRRATVTLSAGMLQAAGLIRLARGQVAIVDRMGLEAVSCECYGVIRHVLAGPAATPR